MNSYKVPNQKDEKHRGTVFFVFGILIALFFGGAIRTMLSPQQVRTFIRKEVDRRKPKFDVEFKEAQLSLSRGWVPRLGLQINELKLTSNNICLNPFHLSVDEVYIPVNVFKFLNKDIQFLNIEFGDIEILALDRSQSCRSQREQDVVIENKISVEGKNSHSFDEFMERFNSFVNTRWSKELENTRRWLTGVDAKNITLRTGKNGSKSHKFENFNFRARSQGEFAAISFNYTPDADVVYYQPLHKIRFDLEVDNELVRLSGQAGYKEGRWKFSGDLLLDSNQFQLRSELKTVPVAEIFQGFSKKGILPNVEGSRPIWLTCEKNMDGSLIQWREARLQISKCLVSGELGSIQLSKTQLQPFLQPFRYQPFKVQLSQFSLENLLDAFNKKPPFKIFHQLGFISGEITFTHPKDILFLGSIHNMSMVFSVNGKKEYQKIPKVSGELLFKDERFSGQIHAIEIEKGEFDGQLSLNLDEKFKHGRVQASVKQLKLHPQILRLLQLDGVSHFEAYGHGEVEDGDVIEWNGSLGFPKLEDKGLKMSKTKFRSSWKDHRWKGVITSNSVRIEKDHPLFQLLVPLYLEENKYSDHIKLRDIETELEIDSETFQWHRAKGWDADRDIVFATNGFFNHSGDLKGEIIVDFPVLKLLSWNIDGTFESPKITPSAKMLKELAKKKPEMTAPTTIEFVSEKFYLPKAFQGNPSESLKKIKNKVMDSAKKILPPKKD